MSRVDVTQKVLNWAIRRANRTPESLLKKFPKIFDWINGEGMPTFKQLQRLAKATQTPLGYFFLNEPPELELPIPHFRTIKDEEPSQPSPNLLDSIHHMQRRQSWLREFLIETGREPLAFVSSSTPKMSPVDVAKEIRVTLGLSPNWAASKSSWEESLVALREAMESAGIIVVVNGVVGNNTSRKLEPKEFRGFVLVDKYAPLVFINGSDGKAAQMFTIAHELAHIFLGSSASFDLRNLTSADHPSEQSCNRIAAEFLIPRNEIIDFWPQVANRQEPFQLLAQRFKVSTIVAARRALDLNLIDRETFFGFYEEYRNDERRRRENKSSGGHFYNNQNVRVGKTFGRAVIMAAKEGRLHYSDAFSLTGLHGKTFDKFAAHLEAGEKS